MTLNPVRAFRPRPQAENSANILRLLAAPAPNWPEVALVAARDPALCLALLSAVPLRAGAPGDDLGEGLNAALRKRLETLGADLLRTWLYGLATAADSARDAHALLTAECALHLALETRYPRPDEAYLTGLWLAPAGFGVGAAAPGSDLPALQHGHPLQADSLRPLVARAARDCGLPAVVGDTLELGPLLEEQLLGAHPLLRLVHAARQLAGSDWENRLEAIGRYTGLSAGTLRSLRTDVAYIVAGHAAYPPPAQSPAHPAVAAPPADDPFRAAALHGLIIAAFADLPDDEARARLAVACPLLCLRDAPPVLAADEQGRLRPLLSGSAATTGTWLTEIDLAEDDAASCIALAVRSGRPTAHFSPAPARSIADWQVGRWLGRRGFCCLPVPIASGHAVALIALDREQELGGTERWLLTELLGAGTRAIRNAHAARNAIATREAALRSRFREHVRRIAHEATNPLTVIRTRLDLLGQRHANDPSVQEEMALLNAELERIGKLLQRTGELPADELELARCNLTELLLDMRALYGETLFANKGIALELRAASKLPPAAIPPSALKQVLLNLFRNAAEALQPGGRLSVALAGQAIANGRNCVEIRLVDNGPGLPPERMHDLFSARPSTKGGSHQGVGLSVVQDILAQWNASILCRSQSGSGTSFQIFIPLEQSN